ncbi:hypothetical protein P3S67_032466 [Capsicum chacoense]
MANKFSFFFYILLVSLAVEVRALRDLPLLLEEVQVIMQTVQPNARCFIPCKTNADCKHILTPRKCTQCRKRYFSSSKACYAPT